MGGVTFAPATALRAGVVRADQALRPEAQRLPRVGYVGDTGHYLGGACLAWWRQHGGERALGWPVTELERIDGTDVQFFERGALARERPGNSAFAVRPVGLGHTWANAIDGASLETTRGDSTSAYWFRRSGRGVHPAFWRTFVDNGGAFAFGYPISNAVVRDGRLAQWFARARMRETDDGVVVDDLGFWEAVRLRVSTSRVGRSVWVPLFRPSLFEEDLGAAESRWVEVDVPGQLVTFFVGDQAVRHAIISTGRVPGWTPDGSWPIFFRKLDERMRGPDSSAPDYYDLSNVYFTQYFTREWHALHYAWWHDEFGTVQSRGCINMRYDDAPWAWEFCDAGTPIVFHNEAGFQPRRAV